MSGRPEIRSSVTLRQGGVTGGWGVSAAVWACCLVFLALTLGEGDSPGFAARAVLLLALIAWCGWLIGAFCRVVVTRQDIRIVNLLRTTLISRNHILDVHDFGLPRVRYLDRDVERSVVAWGAPVGRRLRLSVTSKDPLREAAFRDARSTAEFTAGPLSRALDAVTREPSMTEHPAERRWNVPQLTTLAGLVVCNVAIWFL